MRKQSRIISVFLGLMLAVAGVFSQAGFAPTAQAQTTSRPTTALSSIMGYSTENGYNYVYFGEYPKTRVLKQKPKVTGEANYGTYTPESILEETTIKGYIKTLNENYYRNVLNQPTYVWTDETANTTQVQNFYPQADCENANVSFDFRSGYYTLKTAVGTYPVGSKFHTYNQTVAFYEKMGSGYDSVTSTGTTGSGYAADTISGITITPTTFISAGVGYRRNVTETTWFSDPDETGSPSAFNKLLASKIYLFTVEPIKWRVLANDGNQLTLLADTILDSAYIKIWQYYQTEWAYSDIRGWLNGKTTTTFNTSATATTTYTRHYEGRNFLTRAFTPEQAAAINEKQIIQDSDASYYAGAWHCYADATATVRGVAVEARPVTNDKIYLLSQPEIFGTYNTLNASGADSNLTKAGSPNASYGLTNAGSRIAYNTDYSIATGNYDYELRYSNYSQNTSSGNGGNWWSRSALVYYTYSARGVDYDGSIGYNSSNYSYGVRPAFNLSISNLASGGLASEPVGGAPAADCGTSSAPIALAQSPTQAGNEYAIWTVSGDQSNALGSSGSWRVAGVMKNSSDDTSTNKIEVTFANIKLGTTLWARALNSSGETVALGAITPVIKTSAKASGTAYFSFTSEGAVEDFDIEVFSAENFTLFNCGILPSSEASHPGKLLSTVYLDPAGTNGGSDSNTGKTTYSPVATLSRARALVAKGGNVIFMSTLVCSEDTTLNFGDFTVSNTSGCTYIIRIENGAKAIVNDFNLSNNLGLGYTTFLFTGSTSLTLNNCKVISGRRVVTSTFGNNSLVINGGEYIFLNKQTPFWVGGNIVVNNAYFHDSNTSDGIFSWHDLYYGTHTVSPYHLTLNNCVFENNSGGLGSVANMNAGSLTVNGGRFANNTATVGGVFYVNALNGADCPVTINGAVFEGNSTSGTYVLPTANYDVKHSGTGEDTDAANTLAGAGAIFCTQPLTITNTQFIGNSANRGGTDYSGGGAVYIAGEKASLEIENCIFDGNNAAGPGGVIRVIKPGSGIPKYVKVTNSIFKENSCSGNDGGVIYTVSELQKASTVQYCEFSKNTAANRGAVIFGGPFNFSNCIFSDNSSYNSGSAIYVGRAYNCIFYNNYATYGAAGVITWGTVFDCVFYQNSGGYIIDNSSAHNSIFFHNKVTAILQSGSTDRGLYNCNIYENFFSSVATTGGTVTNCRIYNNHIDGTAGIIRGGTVSNCEIYENYCVGDYATLTGTCSNVTFANNITQSPSGGFAVDNETATFSGKISVYGNRIGADYREKTFTVGTTNTSVTIRIPIVGADGNLQGGTPNTATLPDGDGAAPPSMASYATPTLTLPLDKITLLPSDDLSQWVSGATIKDSDGNPVSGTWRVNSSNSVTVAFTATTLSLRFYPTHADKYSTALTITVNIARQASAIYYARVVGENSFYLDASPTSASQRLTNLTITQAVSFLANNATLSFATPYLVAAGEDISLSADGRNLTFVRTHTGEMFNVAAGGILRLGARAMAGKLTLSGGSTVSGQKALIVNAGTLNIYGNVSITSARNVSNSLGNSEGGGIYNSGTADLDFAEIKDCRVMNSDTKIGFGGAIFNSGTMNVANVRISDCWALCGGAIYSTGKLNMALCLLERNKGWFFGASEVRGNAIGVQGGTGAVFRMTDCKIFDSSVVTGVDGTPSPNSVSSGGGIFVQGEIVAEIFFSTIGNCSAAFGGGIYVAGTNSGLKANNLIIQNCRTSNTQGSAIFCNGDASNVELTDCIFLANEKSGGTVQPGEDGLYGTSGSFVLASAGPSGEDSSSADGTSARFSADGSEAAGGMTGAQGSLVVALGIFGVLALFALSLTLTTKLAKKRKGK